MRLTNTAHGDFIILAAFAAFSVVLCSACRRSLRVDRHGAAAARRFRGRIRFAALCLERHAGPRSAASLVVTFGLAIVIQNLLQEILYRGSALDSSRRASNTRVSRCPMGWRRTLPLLIFAIAVVMAIAMQWLFDHTASGGPFVRQRRSRRRRLMGLDYATHALATGIALC